jgi:hypothetical protein
MLRRLSSGWGRRHGSGSGSSRPALSAKTLNDMGNVAHVGSGQRPAVAMGEATAPPSEAQTEPLSPSRLM